MLSTLRAAEASAEAKRIGRRRIAGELASVDGDAVVGVANLVGWPQILAVDEQEAGFGGCFQRAIERARRLVKAARRLGTNVAHWSVWPGAKLARAASLNAWSFATWSVASRSIAAPILSERDRGDDTGQ